MWINGTIKKHKENAIKNFSIPDIPPLNGHILSKPIYDIQKEIYKNALEMLDQHFGQSFGVGDKTTCTKCSFTFAICLYMSISFDENYIYTPKWLNWTSKAIGLENQIWNDNARGELRPYVPKNCDEVFAMMMEKALI